MSQELLGLHNLQKNPTAKKRRIRRGRGNASGHGNYSGKGMKGQKSRSGASGLKLRGIKSYLQRIPKQKGFKSARPNNLPINLAVLDKYFEAGEIVSLKSLVKKNLIPAGNKNIKILASGNITKKLVIKIDSLSVKAKEAIIKAGGEVIEPIVRPNAKAKKIFKGRQEVKTEIKPKAEPKTKAKAKAKPAAKKSK
ncbi:50S ribosomal protein L15 [Patescibacteria group bacterium]|nr:50S ribosomal protein L15 [Patescibacteria group bacterium]